MAQCSASLVYQYFPMEGLLAWELEPNSRVNKPLNWPPKLGIWGFVFVIIVVLKYSCLSRNAQISLWLGLLVVTNKLTRDLCYRTLKHVQQMLTSLPPQSWKWLPNSCGLQQFSSAVSLNKFPACCLLGSPYLPWVKGGSEFLCFWWKLYIDRIAQTSWSWTG